MGEIKPARNYINNNNRLIKLPLNILNELFTNWYTKSDKNLWFMLKDVTQLPNCEGNFFQLIYTSLICNTIFIF